MSPIIYTLGTSTRSLGDFLAILGAKGITQVCDVRSFPVSKRYPQFSKEPLAASLGEAGVTYRWLGETLGGYRKGGYQAHMKTADFTAGLRELEGLGGQAPTAIICAELLPWKCHRRYIAGALEERGWEVIHLLDASRGLSSLKTAGRQDPSLGSNHQTKEYSPPSLF